MGNLSTIYRTVSRCPDERQRTADVLTKSGYNEGVNCLNEIPINRNPESLSLQSSNKLNKDRTDK